MSSPFKKLISQFGVSRGSRFVLPAKLSTLTDGFDFSAPLKSIKEHERKLHREFEAVDVQPRRYQRNVVDQCLCRLCNLLMCQSEA